MTVAYTGPRLEPSRFLCGWCLDGVAPDAHAGCRVWYSSPGSGPTIAHNGKIPCACEHNRDYLDTVFGPGWERASGKRSGSSLRLSDPSSNVTGSLPNAERHTNLEVEVSDTITEETAAAPADEFAEYEKPEGVESVAVEVPAEPEPAVAEPEPVPADGDGGPVTAAPPVEADAKKARAPRTDLEPLVKDVTDDFVLGVVELGEGEHLTPHRIAKEIKEKKGLEKAPSTGAVSSVLDRWVAINFAKVNPKPKAFLTYTDEAREKGLSALKAEAAAARKAAKAGDKSEG